MRVETKDSVVSKIKEIRQRMEKDKSDKVADGKRKGAKAGHDQKEEIEGDGKAESSKAGGS